ncbi:MAG: FAD-dependent oxidoreductase, partial [Planctomycetota bacterium]|nr:FAD-dependent oxidoreductase [Planctomycetota bacterium]
MPSSLQHTSRRSFLKLAAAGSTAALIPSCWNSPPSKSFDIPGDFVGGSFRIGHLLRQPDFASKIPEKPEEELEVVIVGGGISGLSAAWKLRKSGVKNLCVLELEPSLGGTSSYGRANGTEFPWAAHYLNIPPPEADCLNEVLEDIGVIRGLDKSGFPEVPDEYLLKWPKERLFWKGQWREWDPHWKAPEWEQEVLMQFEDDMLRWTLFKGRDGRRAFALPMMYSSRDPRVLKLDQISFRDYIRSKGWNSPRLEWELNYACRDDYGGTIETISAWAGIHYHACRNYDPRLHQEYPSHTMTWPAGNGFLVQKLAEGIADKRTGCLALSIENRKGHTEVGYYDVEKQSYHRVRAQAVVFAAKQHTAPFVIPGLPEEQNEVFSEITFTPWLTAAIHVKRLPTDVFHPPAWDNMIYKGDALGYIVADHQNREQRETDAPSVLVYYLPF